MRTVLVQVLVLTTVGALVLGACGSAADAPADGRPRLVVTTNVLGDVVRALVGPDATVEVLMPPSANPHDFAPSARQVASLRGADAVIVNGLGFEAGLVDAVESARHDGTVILTATDGVTLRSFGDDDDHGHDDDDDDHDHAGDDHDHEGDDPHFFASPRAMAEAVDHLAAELVAHVPALDTPGFAQRVADYRRALAAVDAEVVELLVGVPPERRILVTNHDVLGYFAAAYGFEVLGVVIPGGTTLAEASAADLADLARRIDRAGVPAIFAETSALARLAAALAAEGTGVEVVELFTESLGPAGSGAETYLDLVRTNATRIAAALAG